MQNNYLGLVKNLIILFTELDKYWQWTSDETNITFNLTPIGNRNELFLLCVGLPLDMDMGWVIVE